MFEKFLEFFWKFFGNFSGGFFWEDFFWRNFFGVIFWEKFFRRFFLGGFVGRIFFGRIFLEDLFFRILLGGFFLRGILREEFFVYVGLSRFCINKEGRKEGKQFRSLEVRRKLIGLKKENVWRKRSRNKDELNDKIDKYLVNSERLLSSGFVQIFNTVCSTLMHFQQLQSTPLRLSEISEKNWSTKAKVFLTFNFSHLFLTI